MRWKSCWKGSSVYTAKVTGSFIRWIVQATVMYTSKWNPNPEAMAMLLCFGWDNWASSLRWSPRMSVMRASDDIPPNFQINPARRTPKTTMPTPRRDIRLFIWLEPMGAAPRFDGYSVKFGRPKRKGWVGVDVTELQYFLYIYTHVQYHGGGDQSLTYVWKKSWFC